MSDSAIEDSSGETVMNEEAPLTIYEYLDLNGNPNEYICSGHVDSMTFREAVQAKFAVKPMVVQHRWRRSKRIVKRDPEKNKSRVYTTDVACLAEEPGAYAITVGVMQQSGVIPFSLQ